MDTALKLLKSAGLKQHQIKRLIQKIARFNPRWDNAAIIAALAGSFYEEIITPENEAKVALIAEGLDALLATYSRRDRIINDYKIITDYFPV